MPAASSAMPPGWDDGPRWFDEMPAVRTEPDLDRFLPPRTPQSPPETDAGYDQIDYDQTGFDQTGQEKTGEHAASGYDQNDVDPNDQDVEGHRAANAYYPNGYDEAGDYPANDYHPEASQHDAGLHDAESYPVGGTAYDTGEVHAPPHPTGEVPTDAISAAYANDNSGYVPHSGEYHDNGSSIPVGQALPADAEQGGSWDEQAIDADDLLAGTVQEITPDPHDLLELRQIAGLTAGTVLPLDRSSYAFAEGENDVGFRVEVLGTGRVDVIPEAATVSIDTVQVTEPTAIGLGVLDVGSARFIVRNRHRHARDWPDDRQTGEIEPPLIHVPPDLTAAPSAPAPAKRRRRFFADDAEAPTLDAVTWEFIETVREARGETAERERFLHPDPTDLAARARHGASSLGMRRPGDRRFAQVGVMCADMNWMPRFDDIHAVPESLGDHLRPLMSLPSVPIVADLLVGPLGITGPRGAVLACGRHIMLSLYGLSTADLTLHVITDPGQETSWEWASGIAPRRPIDPRYGYPVLVVDGAHNFPGATGVDHQLVMAGRAGLVVLADQVEQLPSYCGTVLQVDRSGSGLLTNHQGKVINGTPIGVTTGLAGELAVDLNRSLGLRS